jgi:hypothetical protein
LTRGLDTNQVVIFQNGFFQDFLRAQSNLALFGNPACTVADTATRNCQVLTIFPRLGSGGNLADATIRNLITTGQVGELVSNYVQQRNTFLLTTQPCVQPASGGAGTLCPSFFLPNNPNAFVTDYIGSSGWSNYHGLQAEIRRRFSGGYYYQINYTWSKAFTNAEQAQAEFSPYLDNAVGDALEKKRLNQDVQHVLKANAVYELPIGPGKRWLSGGGAAGKFFGGWQISGIAQFRTGRPISFLAGDGSTASPFRGTLNRSARSGNNTPNTSLTLAELQARVGLFHDPRTGLPLVVDPALIGTDGRANPAFFTNPLAGQTGHLSLTPVDGPGYWNVDTAVIKRIRFKERLGVELRLEAFNVFNHTNFSVGNTQDINSPDFGKINSTFDQRIIQLAWKFTF